MLESEDLVGGFGPSLLVQLQQHVHAASDRFDTFVYALLPALAPSSSGTGAPVVAPSLLVLLTLTSVVLLQLLFSLQRSYLERGEPIRLPLPEPARPGWKGTVLHQPTVRASPTSQTITCYDPATGYHIADLPADTPETIAAKLDAARRAQARFADSPFSLRRKVLRTIQRWIVSAAEDITRVAARDTGKTAIDAAFGELLTTCSKLEWTIAHGQRILQPEIRGSNLLLAHKRCEVHHEPLGVVLACVSWNYSAHNTMGPVISALFSGNAIVVKASELVAWSATYFIDGIRECLRAAGADPELVQLVVCFPEAVESLTTSEEVKHITFIGSEEVGRKVAVAATQQLTPVTLELGGKDPAILLKSADLRYFQSTFMRSCFQGAGQNCIGIERFIVDASLVPTLISLVQPRIEALCCGSFMDDVPFGSIPPSSASDDDGAKVPREDVHVDVGAMITDARFDRLEFLLDDAVQRGARILVGGKRLRHPKWTEGHYFSPTLVVDVTPDMPIANEELFAPIFLILPFPTGQIDRAIALANGTRYGLGSSVFGANKAECTYVASKLHCGMVNINDFGVSYLNQSLPFGGTKKSGYGRFGGPEGLLALTSCKAITSDRLFATVRTGIPAPLDYPLTHGAQSWRFVVGLVRMAYASSWRERVRGVVALVRGSL